MDYYFSLWQCVLKYIGDDYAVQERFFRHNYNAFRRVVNAQFFGYGETRYPLGNLATRSNLLSIYEKVIKKNPKMFLDNVISNASIYSKIIVKSTEGVNTELLEGYQNLARVRGAPSYLLLLYLEKERETLALDDGDIINTVTLLIKYFVRRNITDDPPTRDLTRIFMALIERIERDELKGVNVFQTIRDVLLMYSAGDYEFKQKLQGDVYSDNVDVTRFILCMLAEQGMTAENKVDLWKKTEGKLYAWTIEHIFPQGENIPQKWIDMVAGGDKFLASRYQSEYTHKLGNLTITGYNSTLGNRSFDEKKNRTDNKGRFIGYRNGLNLNKDLESSDVWTIDNIQSRTERLVNDAFELFSM